MKVRPVADDHVAALLRAREKLVQQRRNLATSLGDDQQRGHIDDRRSQFVEIQQALDALDDAIDDVRTLSRALRTADRVQQMPGVRIDLPN
jgi:hypothetical protein